MVVVNPISNLHTLAGKSVSERDDKRFKEYRRLWSERPKNFDAGNFPLFLDIEVTNNCNLRCTFCATSYFDKKVKRGYIDFDLVKRVIDEGKAEGLYGVKFNDRGEPLLHPRLTEMIRYAKEAKLIDIYFNTNALLLDGNLSRRLIDTGLDRISISFEGSSRKVYEKYRVKSSFDRVVANARNLRDLRERLGADRPKIRIQSVNVPEMQTENARSAYVSFWHGIADEICILDYKEESDHSKRLVDFPYLWACSQLFQRMVVWWDGSILPCNEDDRGKLILGNVRDISIKSAWNSVYLNLLREKHCEGKAHQIPPCNGCYLRDSEIKKLLKVGEKHDGCSFTGKKT